MSDNGTVIDSPLVNAAVVGVDYDNPSIANVTGATAGSPGSWTPAGAEGVPADAADATRRGITASPATSWTTGQYVHGTTAGAPGDMTWTGSAWVGGRAPLAEGESADAAEATTKAKA